jgi:hypothetical protein
MWKYVLGELREIVLLTSMVAILSLLSLGVALGAVTIAESQVQHLDLQTTSLLFSP